MKKELIVVALVFCMFGCKPRQENLSGLRGSAVSNVAEALAKYFDDFRASAKKSAGSSDEAGDAAASAGKTLDDATAAGKNAARRNALDPLVQSIKSVDNLADETGEQVSVARIVVEFLSDAKVKGQLDDTIDLIFGKNASKNLNMTSDQYLGVLRETSDEMDSAIKQAKKALEAAANDQGKLVEARKLLVQQVDNRVHVDGILTKILAVRRSLKDDALRLPDQLFGEGVIAELYMTMAFHDVGKNVGKWTMKSKIVQNILARTQDLRPEFLNGFAAFLLHEIGSLAFFRQIAKKLNLSPAARARYSRNVLGHNDGSGEVLEQAIVGLTPPLWWFETVGKMLGPRFAKMVPRNPMGVLAAMLDRGDQCMYIVKRVGGETTLSGGAVKITNTEYGMSKALTEIAKVGEAVYLGSRRNMAGTIRQVGGLPNVVTRNGRLDFSFLKNIRLFQETITDHKLMLNFMDSFVKFQVKRDGKILSLFGKDLKAADEDNIVAVLFRTNSTGRQSYKVMNSLDEYYKNVQTHVEAYVATARGDTAVKGLSNSFGAPRR